jgi:hypothetical protein
MMLVLSLFLVTIAYGAVSYPVLTAEQQYNTVVSLVQNINADPNNAAETKLDLIKGLRKAIVNLNALEAQFGPIDNLAVAKR